MELKLESIREFKLKSRPEFIEWELALIIYETEITRLLKDKPTKLEIYLSNLSILRNNRITSSILKI